MRANTFSIVISSFAAASFATATPLEPFLLRSSDLPGGCAQVTGQYPTGPKIESLYQYKTYQSVLPKAADRHAQSFNCAGERGTVYYFQYWSAGDKDKAALFARPVISKEIAGWIDWANGFAVFSFKQAPTALMEVLRKKTGAVDAPVVSGSTTPTTAKPPVQRPTPLPMPSGGSVSSFSATSGPVATTRISRPPKTPVKPPIATPVPVVEAAPLPPSGLPDIPDEVLGALARMQGCNANSPLETRKVCQTLVDFRAAHRPSGFIPPTTALIAQAYRIDSYGRLAEKYYDVLIGSGRAGEITLFSIKPTDGTGDFEAQSVFEAKQKGQGLPMNAVRAQIDRHPRPDRPMVGATDRVSIVFMGTGDQRVYLRQKDNRWIALSVNGATAEEQARSSFVAANFY
jgi:hypothetical protein